MADCVAHETENVECQPGDVKCTKEVEETTTEAAEKPEVTEAGDVPNSKDEATEEPADGEEEASRKRKTELPETDEADGVDEAKKAKTDEPAEEANGDKAENGKEAEEAPKEIAQKTVEDVQRLSAEADNEEVAA
jgi:hypothetical protein